MSENKKLELSNDFNMPFDYKSNGCGSGWSARIIPNTIYFVSIKKACAIHDYAYLVGKILADKEKADREFKNNMLRIVNNVKKWYYPTRLARVRAEAYFKSVDRFGGPAFWDKKEEV